ncbi:MAG: hypothetical protein J7K90_10150 [Desulfuromusa sp.]|nr:hypothetical protein [Desulfuromusa sp.]
MPTNLLKDSLGNLSDYLGWSENLTGCDQTLAHLRVIVIAIGRKGAEV